MVLKQMYISEARNMTNNVYAAYVHLNWSRVEHVLFSVKEQPIQTETLLSNRLAMAVHTCPYFFFFFTPT